MPAVRRLLALAVLAASLCLAPAATATTNWFTQTNPIDPSQLTSLTYPQASATLQPWRSSLITRPATSLENAIGINFNVQPSEADATARLLADSGFHRARVELSWVGMSYDDPSQISDRVLSDWTTEISALRKYGLRPLVLLNANSQLPGPSKVISLTLTAPAPKGATTVSLDASSAAQVIPGLTGFQVNDAQGYQMGAGVLITSVDANGVATLSRPLPQSLPAGTVIADTMRYHPFAKPYLADGTPNPRFQQTMSGWLTYVRSVSDFVRSVYGSDNFDVEVWNELSFGADFLDESNYFNPLPDPGATGDTQQAILAGTEQTLHDPANGLTDVQVGDGFANENPLVSGATVPAGTNAVDRHLYPYPYSDATHGRSFMPEYFLTGAAKGTVMRDLSPIQTTIDGVPHGAGTHPAGGAAPGVWVTEGGLDADSAQQNGLPDADLPEFEAKAALRAYTSYASAGAQAVDLFAAAWESGDHTQWSMINPSFFSTLDASPSSYPGDAAGGQAMQALSRMTSTLSGAQPIAQPRQLSLSAIASDTNDAQFGSGAPGSTLYNRNVLTFFPFQVNAHRFVSSVYVMTRDLTHVYTSNPAPGQTPYDLPAENFRLTIGGVNSDYAVVSLLDPLTGTSQPASVVSRNGSTIVVQVQATDSPRMLTIDDSPSNGVQPGAGGSAGSAANGNGAKAGAASIRLRLVLPRRVAARTARRRGIRLTVRSPRAGNVTIVATSVGAHNHRVARKRIKVRLARNRRLAVKLSVKSLNWLRRHHVKRLRFTARVAKLRATGTLRLTQPR